MEVIWMVSPLCSWKDTMSMVSRRNLPDCLTVLAFCFSPLLMIFCPDRVLVNLDHVIICLFFVCVPWRDFHYSFRCHEIPFFFFLWNGKMYDFQTFNVYLLLWVLVYGICKSLQSGFYLHFTHQPSLLELDLWTATGQRAIFLLYSSLPNHSSLKCLLKPW